ncbi:DsbA family oxidoreductase [Pseudomonas batumici]|uniref:DsbA family oxidoreductase n=1 Tax=Pseudomonas batumici TaxID=226910 RepID=UPI0030CF8792
MNVQTSNSVSSNIQVAYDFICPWCWIGEENLERALVAADLSVDSHITFLPYQLNPDMPVEGMDRKAYRSAKFGSWARSQAMDAQVTAAGRAVGLKFDYERAEKTPNTLAAHRLVWREQQAGRNASSLVKAIFKAYFGEGRDIGDLNVLADIAAETGLDRAKALGFLESGEGTTELLELEAATKASGIRSVPSIHIGAHVISGAQPLEVMAQVLRQSQLA